MEEIWKDIKGYEGSYQVSNLGRVKSLTRFIKRETEPCSFYTIKERIMKLKENNRGYLTVMLSSHCKSKGFSVHRLVAEAFLENPSKLPFVNHKDENKLNNHVDNLEWCDNYYNFNYSNVKQRAREKQGKPIEQFDLNGNFIKVFNSIGEAVELLGLNRSNLCRCLSEKSSQCAGYIWKYKK